jgi:hypothetical protein
MNIKVVLVGFPIFELCCLRSTLLTCSLYIKLYHLCIFSTWVMKWVLRCLFLDKFHCPAFSSIDVVSSFGSPDDWECFLHYLGCLLEDGSIWCDEAVNDPVHPPKFVSCKVSHLSDEQVNILSLRVFNYDSICLELDSCIIVNYYECSLTVKYQLRQLFYGSYKQTLLIIL